MAEKAAGSMTRLGSGTQQADTPSQVPLVFRHALISFVLATAVTSGHTEAKGADRNGRDPAPGQAAVQAVTLAGTGYQVSFDAPRDWIGDAAARAQLLNAIAAWLSVSFELPLVRSVPSIKLESGPRMTSFRYTGLLSGRPEEVAKVSRGRREVDAIYDPGSDTIFLRQEWTGSTPAELSILVHEMVHYIQDVAEFKYPCVAASEELAYVAQERWLGLFGTNLAAEFGVDRLTLFANTRCFH